MLEFQLKILLAFLKIFIRQCLMLFFILVLLSCALLPNYYTLVGQKFCYILVTYSSSYNKSTLVFIQSRGHYVASSEAIFWPVL